MNETNDVEGSNPPIPVSADSAGPLTKDLGDIIAYVKRTHLLGERAAKRFVGRNLNQVTLSNWRKYGKFPVGRRHPAAQVHDDSGRQLKEAARSALAIRKAGTK